MTCIVFAGLDGEGDTMVLTLFVLPSHFLQGNRFAKHVSMHTRRKCHQRLMTLE